MKNLNYILFLLPFFLLVASCDDDTILPTPETDVPGLPPATQTGAGTFGCLVDGEPWVAKSAPFASGSTVGLRVTHYPDWNGFTIGAYNNDDRKSLTIHMSHVNVEGLYEIDRASRGYLSTSICWKNETPVDSSFYVNISRLDYSDRIISGNFSFFTRNEDDNCPEIEISSGRFDATF